MAAVTPSEPIESKRMPSLCRQPGQRSRADRAFIKVRGKRLYVGESDDPRTAELYNRLKAVWKRTGELHLDILTGDSPADDAETTITHVAVAFIRYAKKRYVDRDGQPSKEFHNFRVALRLLRRLYGSLPADSFGPKKLRAVRDAMAVEPKVNNESETWSRKYVNDQMKRIKRVFKWAKNEELIPASVYDAIRDVPSLRAGERDVRPSRKVGTVPQESIDAIRPHVSRQVWALIQLQLLTGARSGEILGLRAIDLNTSGEVWTVEVAEHKTEHHDKTRTLYLGPQAQAIIQPFMANRAVDRSLFSPTEADAERRAELHAKRKTPLSHGNRPGTNRRAEPLRTAGDTYTPGSYRRAIQYACLKVHPYPAELTEPVEKPGEVAAQRRQQKAWRERHCWHPHQLRHNYATMIRQHFGIEEAKTMLDHSSLDVTLIYAERNREKAVEIAGKVG